MLAKYTCFTVFNTIYSLSFSMLHWSKNFTCLYRLLISLLRGSNPTLYAGLPHSYNSPMIFYGTVLSYICWQCYTATGTRTRLVKPLVLRKDEAEIMPLYSLWHCGETGV